MNCVAKYNLSETHIRASFLNIYTSVKLILDLFSSSITDTLWAGYDCCIPTIEVAA